MIRMKKMNNDNIQMATNAYQLRQAIEKETVEVEESGIKITIGGDLKIKSISINSAEQNDLKEAINHAIRKAQEMQVMKMKELIG